MDRPPFSTVLSTAVASAATFFVITRSGIAGTLAGAAVASLVYTGASHGMLRALERLVRGLRRWGFSATGAPVHEAPRAIPAEKDGRFLSGTLLPPPAVRRRPAKSVVATWGPLLLAAAALATSLYSVTTGTPIERVVVHERVMERPVVTERVVVQREIVTVPQSPLSESALPAPGIPTTTTTLGATGQAATTTTTAPAPPTTSTTSTVPPISTTAGAAPAP